MTAILRRCRSEGPFVNRPTRRRAALSASGALSRRPSSACAQGSPRALSGTWRSSRAAAAPTALPLQPAVCARTRRGPSSPPALRGNGRGRAALARWRSSSPSASGSTARMCSIVRAHISPLNSAVVSVSSRSKTTPRSLCLTGVGVAASDTAHTYHSQTVWWYGRCGAVIGCDTPGDVARMVVPAVACCGTGLPTSTSSSIESVPFRPRAAASGDRAGVSSGSALRPTPGYQTTP